MPAQPIPTARPPRPRGPRLGRPEGRFTQHRRIDKLREILENEPRGLTLEAIASMLRITHRSVRRYLRELDGSTDLESIETTKGGAHLWRIKPSERGRAVQLRRTQAYAILSTRRALGRTVSPRISAPTHETLWPAEGLRAERYGDRIEPRSSRGRRTSWRKSKS